MPKRVSAFSSRLGTARCSDILGAGMERPPRPSFEPAGAGGLLVATIVALAGIGALIGWILGNAAIGAAVGTAVGIPAGAFVVYLLYREYFN
jgi:hypothetical protein